MTAVPFFNDSDPLRILGTVALTVGLVSALATVRVARARHARSLAQNVGSPSALPRKVFLSEDAVRDSDIVFYERRVAEDPESATDRSTLATLYLQRARASGGVSDYARAEVVARRSLALRTEHNGQTFALLASALLARHAFEDARTVARQADSLDPGRPAHIALLGEVELELGHYSAADSLFHSLRYDVNQFAVAARVARWRELTGHAAQARAILRRCIQRMASRDDLPREQRAWFHYRLAELDARTGRWAAADSSYQRGLEIFPDDYRILAGLAHLSALRQQWPAAVSYGERAIAIQLDPTVLGVVSDAYRQLGERDKAAEYARAMQVSALRQPGPIHRAWGLFVLDHGTAVERTRVLAKARADLRTRQDVYGYDLFAWGLFRTGRVAEAREPMARALAQGTEDPQLFEHAAEIENASGSAALASDYRAKAAALRGGSLQLAAVTREPGK